MIRSAYHGLLAWKSSIQRMPLLLQGARQVGKSYLLEHFGKTNAVHIVSVFENVPMQLAKNREGSVKRYRVKDVIQRKRSFAELQGPIDWLVKAGLVSKVKICNRSELPLEAFCKDNFFKLLVFDIGLLGCMLDLPPDSSLLTVFILLTILHFPPLVPSWLRVRKKQAHTKTQISAGPVAFFYLLNPVNPV